MTKRYNLITRCIAAVALVFVYFVSASAILGGLTTVPAQARGGGFRGGGFRRGGFRGGGFRGGLGRGRGLGWGPGCRGWIRPRVRLRRLRLRWRLFRELSLAPLRLPILGVSPR